MSNAYLKKKKYKFSVFVTYQIKISNCITCLRYHGMQVADTISAMHSRSLATSLNVTEPWTFKIRSIATLKTNNIVNICKNYVTICKIFRTNYYIVCFTHVYCVSVCVQRTVHIKNQTQQTVRTDMHCTASKKTTVIIKWEWESQTVLIIYCVSTVYDINNWDCTV